MEDILQNLGNAIGMWGYAIIFFYSLGGGLVAIFAAGIISSGVVESINPLNIYLCILVAAVGNFIGSSILFYIARNQKAEVIKYLYKHKRKIALSHIWIKKYDFFVIFFHKYIYGIKAIIPMAIGIGKYSARKFLIYNVFASLVWAILIGGISYFMGSALKRLYDEYSNPYIFPIAGILIICIIALVVVKTARKHR